MPDFVKYILIFMALCALIEFIMWVASLFILK